MKAANKNYQYSIYFLLFGLVCLMTGLFLGYRYFQQVGHRPIPRRIDTQRISIEGWMTLPFVAHEYQIPVSNVFAKLNIEDNARNRNLSLDAIAKDQNITSQEFIKKVKTAIAQ